MRHFRLYLLVLVVVITGLFILHYSGLTWRAKFEKVSKSRPVGMEKVDCWFHPKSDWPASECYYVHVPESHDRPEGHTIAFPLVIFRSKRFFSTKPPVLHLGAGGPGAPMGLDSTESVRTIWEYHDDFSLDVGRDLFVIDPRGSGLSRPLLTCDVFVENQTRRLRRNLTVIQEWELADEDYRQCNQRFLSQGVDFSGYNSLSIARDIELLRRLTHTERWLLVGVSYAAIYAQLVANEYPHTVEAMILDSATFPGMKPHHRFLERTLAPYEKLYHYCDIVPDCERPIENIETRLWSLHRELNKKPLRMEISQPYDTSTLPVVLNGERFIAALIEGVYGPDIFYDLPRIIEDLEKRNTDSIQPYVEDHVAYLLDRTYGDVSDEAHYCYEVKPFTDKKKMKRLARQLPAGYIRDITLLSLDWPDLCEQLQIGKPDPRVARSLKTDIPVLFLQGSLDTITTLEDVHSQIGYFENSQIVTYQVSHSVMTSDGCAEEVAARFVLNHEHLPVDTGC